MIDYWCNAFTPDREPLWQAVIEQDGLTIKLGAREDDAFCSVAEMVDRMNRAAIATLILPVCDLEDGSPLDHYAHYALRPTELHQLAATHPGRFVGMYSVSLDQPGDIEAADEALHSAWCVGIHNHTHSWDHGFDSAALRPYYELAAKHGVPVVMQAGSSGGHRDHNLGHPDAIATPATEFSTVDFVLSHLGLPWLDETIAAARAHTNVLIGTATQPPRRWSAELLNFIESDGADRVLFGSGYPLTGHLHIQAQLDALDIPAATKEALRQGNARRIFTRIPARVGG